MPRMTNFSSRTSCSLFYVPDDDQRGTMCAGSNRTSREQDLTFLLVGVPVPLLSMVVNASVLLAAALQRKTLRKYNYVFSSVCSTMLSNMLYAVLSVWMAIANYFGFMEQGIKQTDYAMRKTSEKWWIIRNSTLICLLLAMCGNIGSLVFVLKDSTYFVGRTVNQESIDKAKPADKGQITRGSRWQLTKRGKARILIALSWLGPALLVISCSVTDWNCVECCCPPGHYSGDSCAVDAGCSRFRPPLAHSFLELFLGLWLVEVILLAFLLTHTSLKFRQTMTDRSLAKLSDCEMSSGMNTEENFPNNGNAIAISESQKRRRSLTLPVCEPAAHQIRIAATQTLDNARSRPSLASDAVPKNKQKRKSLSLSFVRKFNSKMKNMMCLTLVFFIFTLPVVLGIIVDISTGNPMPGKDAFIVVSELSTFMYTLVCPIILLKFMPKLKLSVIMCWYKCGKLCDK